MQQIRHILSYDITNDKRRRKLVKIMEGSARRVQFSVFETCLTGGQLEKVIERSMPYVKPDAGDSLRVYRVCGSCWKHCAHIGGISIDWEADLIY